MINNYEFTLLFIFLAWNVITSTVTITIFIRPWLDDRIRGYKSSVEIQNLQEQIMDLEKDNSDLKNELALGKINFERRKI